MPSSEAEAFSTGASAATPDWVSNGEASSSSSLNTTVLCFLPNILDSIHNAIKPKPPSSNQRHQEPLSRGSGSGSVCGAGTTTGSEAGCATASEAVTTGAEASTGAATGADAGSATGSEAAGVGTGSAGVTGTGSPGFARRCNSSAAGIFSTLPGQMRSGLPDSKISGLACTKASIVWRVLSPAGRTRLAMPIRVSPERTVYSPAATRVFWRSGALAGAGRLCAGRGAAATRLPCSLARAAGSSAWRTGARLAVLPDA